MAANSRIYLWKYFAVVAVLVGLCVAAYRSPPSYRSEPIDFSALGERGYIVTRSLNRLQREEIKLGFVERAAPPAVGLFGNHQVSFAAARNFGDGRPGHFFNYFYANMGLPEMYDYLSYLADKDRLPTELLIAQITTPNNDRGLHILTYAYELPSDLLHYATQASELSPWLGYGDAARTRRVKVRENVVDHWINQFPLLAGASNRLPTPLQHAFLTGESWIQDVTHVAHQSLNYATVVSALSRLVGLARENRIVEREACLKGDANPLAGLLGNAALCTKADLHMAFRADGSYDVAYFRSKPLRQNEEAVEVESKWLRSGDEKAIAGFMEKIHQLVTTRGRKMVFLIPPVYETEREGGPDRIVTRALALVPHIPVVDDRRAVREAQYFVNYDHPSPAYYDRLAGVLRARGLLDAADTRP